MHLPRFLRQVNRVVTNPLLGTLAWILPPLAIVHHVGRKSGRRYRTPVVAFRTRTGFVIPMTYGRDVDWAQNMVRAGGAEIERMGRRTPLQHAQIVGFDVAAPQLPAAARPIFGAVDLPGYVLAEAAR
jgi:deazaflavin-dependent oxidoreductase (nitroreductase family)